MKKIISLSLSIIMLLSLLSLVSCDTHDVDLTSKENVYDDLAVFIKSPEDYKDKTVTMTSTYTVVYDFSQNKILRHTLSEFDTTGEKRALYEIRKSDNEFPRVGSVVTIEGRFSGDGYIDVGTIKAKDKGTYDFDRFEFSPKGIKRLVSHYTSPYIESEEFDYDTLELTSTELSNFIQNYRKQYEKSEYYGKTIRIFGHLAFDDKGYAYLIGLDAKGKYLWEIEVYDPEGRFDLPKSEGNTVNPVEIVGELSTYCEKNVIYSCIEIEQIGRVESVFKDDKIDDGLIIP